MSGKFLLHTTFLYEYQLNTGIAIPFIETKYDLELFFEAVRGLEGCPEGDE